MHYATSFFRLVVLGFWLVSSAPALSDSSEQRAIDAAKSSAQFGIEHIFVDRVTGNVPIVAGSVALAADSSIPLRVSAVIDATRIHTGEPDRDSALESADYFDTRNYPTWTFVSTKIVASSPAAYAMEGTLTIHGVAQSEHLDVVVRGDAAHPVYHAVAEIDRHAFGMKGARLDPVIGNTAQVVLDITLK